MSTAIEVHGLRIADGGAIENTSVERLTADPVPVSPGRMWYNETEKVLKFSSLNATGAVVVESFSTVAELTAYIASNDAALAQEASDRASADGALGGRLDIVEGDATQVGSISKALADAQAYADQKITDLLDGAPALLDTLNELAAALGDDANFATTVTQQIADAKSELIGTADGLNDTMGELSGRIDSVASTAASDLATAKSGLETADTALGGRIDALEASVGGSTGNNADLATDNKLTLVGAINEVDANADANAASIATTNTTVASNKSDIEGQLATVKSDLEAADAAQATALNNYQTSNDAALAAEETRAKAAEGTLTGSAFSATENDLTKAVNKVSTDLDSEATRLEGLISTEQGRAEAAEAANATAISDEEAARIAAVAAVQSALDAYETGNDAAVAAEALARANADTALGARIDDVLSNLDPAALDSLTEVVAAFQDADSNLQSSITAALGTHTSELAAAETRLDAEDVRIAGLVSAEATTARAAEAANATAIADEVTNRSTEITRVEGLVTAEATTARAAEGANATAISAETTRATGEETRIDGKVDQEVLDRASADTTLQGNIDSEEAARIAADNQIRSDINGTRFTYQSAVAAVAHTITHGLNSGFLVFNVMVEGSDGVYRNDIAPVTEVDANNLKVELSNARNVKVTVIDMTSI